MSELLSPSEETVYQSSLPLIELSRINLQQGHLDLPPRLDLSGGVVELSRALSAHYQMLAEMQGVIGTAIGNNRTPVLRYLLPSNARDFGGAWSETLNQKHKLLDILFYKNERNGLVGLRVEIDDVDLYRQRLIEQFRDSGDPHIQGIVKFT
mgnify:CR=1 FL=1